MSYKNKMIAPFQIGMQNDIEAWLLPDNAFNQLRNMFLYRGRLRKKFGYEYLGRLTITLTAQALGNTGASPFVANVFTVLGLNGVIIPGSVVVHIAAPIGPLLYTETASPDGTLDDGVGNLGTINYNTGDLSINHPAGLASAVTIDFTYAKGLPVMGLPNRELSSINIEELIAFDTEDAYVWNTVTNQFNIITPAAGGWTGSNSDFFWCTNYWKNGSDNLLWVTNNVLADNIRYYKGGGAGGWTTIVPQLNVANTRTLLTSLILIPYRNRLIALNTTEKEPGGTFNYQSRARWCALGDPTVATNWEDDVPGLGNYIDAPTNEEIVTARFVKDTLVVGFERSTWILKYTFDYTAPFIWERVHSEFGCDSTFSSVVFDNFMLQVSFRGINAANGYSSERIDLKVPYLVQQIQNDNQGDIRVHGIRDYNLQMVYWTYADQQLDQPGVYDKIFPESVIAYNYYEQAFATFDGSFTCFGYYQPANDLTWAAASNINWVDANFAWNSGQTQAAYQNIVAGNQVGFVEIIRQTTSNDISVYINNVTNALPCAITAPNHNLQNGQCIKIVDVIGTTELNNNNYFVANATTNTFTLQYVDSVPTSPTFGQLFDLDSTAFTPYIGYGFVITIDNINILTKQYNLFEPEDVKIRNGYTEFFLNTTSGGQITGNILINQNTVTPVNTITIPTTYSLLPPLTSPREWKRVYFNIVGNYIQYQLTMSNVQLSDDEKNIANIELHGITMAVEESGRRQSFS